MAPKEDLSTRTYNVHAMSFTPEEIFEEVRSDEPYKQGIDSLITRLKSGCQN